MKISLFIDLSFQSPQKNLEKGTHYLSFPMSLGFSGEKRLQELRELIPAEVKAVVQKFGSYELDEGFTRLLRRQGLSISRDGKCSFLSPDSWPQTNENLFDLSSLKQYLAEEKLMLAELFVPAWALRFQSKVREESLLQFYLQMLSPISTHLYFRAEK
jgi:hypothetical protein